MEPAERGPGGNGANSAAGTVPTISNHDRGMGFALNQAVERRARRDKATIRPTSMLKTNRKLKKVVIPVEPVKTGAVKAAGVKTEPPTPAPAKSPVVIVKTVRSELAPKVSPPPNRVSLTLVKPEARQVLVAGSFNDWKPELTPLAPAGDGRWVGDLTVPPGRHEYLFVVDGQWVTDPNAKETVANPFGGKNSVLVASE